MASCLALFLVGVFVYPNLKGEAQKTHNLKEIQDEALLIVRNQPISNTFYETLMFGEKANEKNWILTKGVFHKQSSDMQSLRMMSSEEWYLMEFKLDNSKVNVSIDKYESDELASETFSSLKLSQGSIEKIKGFGDKALKVINDKGKLESIYFTKDNYVISINCNSEDIGKRFAFYALKAIEDQ